MLGNILHLAEGIALGILASSPSLSGDALKASITRALQDAATQQAERVHKGLGGVVATLFSLSITRSLIDRAVDDAMSKASGLLATLPFAAALAAPSAPVAPTGGAQPPQGVGVASVPPQAPVAPPQALNAPKPVGAPLAPGQGQSS